MSTVMHEYSKSINALDCEVKSPFAYIFMNLDFLFLSQISLNLINGLNLRILILYSNRSSSSPSPVPEDAVDAAADAAVDASTDAAADAREAEVDDAAAEGRRQSEAPPAADAVEEAEADADATLAKEPVEAPPRPSRPSRRRDDLMDVESIQDDDSAHAVAGAVLRPLRVAPALPARLA